MTVLAPRLISRSVSSGAPVATTLTPRAARSWMANEPTPPEAPLMSTTCPGCGSMASTAATAAAPARGSDEVQPGRLGGDPGRRDQRVLRQGARLHRRSHQDVSDHLVAHRDVVDP